MRHKYALLLAVFLSVVVLDQASKFLAVARLTNAFEHQNSHTLVERLRTFYTLQNLDNEPYESGNTDHRLAPKPVVSGFWTHKYVENPGAAWGLLSGAESRWRTPFFHVVSLLAIGFILLFYRRLEADQRLLAVALSLVLGGAVGNYVDRLVRGYVIDFVDWHWRDHAALHWPTFNLADAAITVGVLLMVVDSVIGQRAPAQAPDRPQEGLAARREEPPAVGNG